MPPSATYGRLMPRGAQNTPTGAGERARRRQLPGELVYSGLAFAENLPDSAPPHGARGKKTASGGGF